MIDLGVHNWGDFYGYKYNHGIVIPPSWIVFPSNYAEYSHLFVELHPKYDNKLWNMGICNYGY